MIAALDRAMASAPDPEAIARDQAAWRAARDHTADRVRLGELYAQRIEALNAATPDPPT
jgi:hypothetical protein